jgi:hypothetical protein
MESPILRITGIVKLSHMDHHFQGYGTSYPEDTRDSEAVTHGLHRSSLPRSWKLLSLKIPHMGCMHFHFHGHGNSYPVDTRDREAITYGLHGSSLPRP